MVSVCIPFRNNEKEQNEWDYILSNFKIDKLYIIANDDQKFPKTNVYGKGTRINSYSELPQDDTHILLNPKNGRNIKGEESLIDFKHPLENVIYIFGPNNKNLEEDMFSEGKMPDHCVYIPTDTKHDMYSYCAAAVTLYDRKIKLLTNG